MDLVVRIAAVDDAGALAALRARWTETDEPGFANRMADWLQSEGERRTVWLARIVLSPSERAIPFYRRAGFIVPDAGAGDDRLLVRPMR